MPTSIPSHAVIPWEHQQSILERNAPVFPEFENDRWIHLYFIFYFLQQQQNLLVCICSQVSLLLLGRKKRLVKKDTIFYFWWKMLTQTFLHWEHVFWLWLCVVWNLFCIQKHTGQVVSIVATEELLFSVEKMWNKKTLLPNYLVFSFSFMVWKKII